MSGPGDHAFAELNAELDDPTLSAPGALQAVASFLSNPTHLAAHPDLSPLLREAARLHARARAAGDESREAAAKRARGAGGGPSTLTI